MDILKRLYADLKLTHVIVLDTNFIFPEMEKNVSQYLTNHPRTSLAVCLESKIGGNVEERTIERFKNVAGGGFFNRTKITLCLEPESLSPSVLERFKRNPYFTDFYKENSSYYSRVWKRCK